MTTYQREMDINDCKVGALSHDMCQVEMINPGIDTGVVKFSYSSVSQKYWKKYCMACL